MTAALVIAGACVALALALLAASYLAEARHTLHRLLDEVRR